MEQGKRVDLVDAKTERGTSRGWTSCVRFLFVGLPFLASIHLLSVQVFCGWWTFKFMYTFSDGKNTDSKDDAATTVTFFQQ